MTGTEMIRELFDNHTPDELLQLYKDWHRRKETGLSKSPEDILKGLECCSGDAVRCRECPYCCDKTMLGCDDDMLLKDAIAYIKQLQYKLEEKND